MKNTLKKCLAGILAAAVLVVLPFGMISEAGQDLSPAGAQFDNTNLVRASLQYDESTASFSNPERGYYTICGLFLEKPYNAKNDKTVNGELNYQLNEAATKNRSLVQLQINLRSFAGNSNRSDQTPRSDAPISDECLEQIQRAFDMIREKGFKAIVRPLYGWDDTDNYPEPDSFDTILQHLDQLSPILAQNQDVLYTVEGGVLGKWGEWHTTRYNHISYKNQVIDKLLAVVPESCTISLRRPGFYRDRFGSEPLSEALAYSAQPSARVAVYNDAFLSSDTDCGTYLQGTRDWELDWLEQHTRFTPFGGEATLVGSTYNELTNAVKEMRITHCQYINGDSDLYVKNKWKNTVYTGDNDAYNGLNGNQYIEDHLGYRFVLRDSQLPLSMQQGGNASLQIQIENTGFANLIRQRDAELLLEKEGVYYAAQIDTDARNWLAGEQTELQLVFHLPANIETGSWNFYLRLPDASNAIASNERYAIRFANDGLWNAALGANLLGSVQITDGNGVDGDTSFYQANAAHNVRDHEGPAYMLPDRTVMDGQKSDVYEWKSSTVLYQASDDSRIYTKNDEQNLYVYIESPALQNTANFQMFFASSSATNPRYQDKYNFMIENYGNLLASTGYGWGWQSVAGSAGKMKICKGADAFEVKIPLDIIEGVVDESTIYNITFKAMDRNWQPLYSVTTAGLSDVLYDVEADGQSVQSTLPASPVMDGQKTDNTEWTSSDKVYRSTAGDRVYARNDADNLYLFVESSQMQNAANFQLFFANSTYTSIRYADKYNFMIENQSGLFTAAGAGWNWAKAPGSEGVKVAKGSRGCEVKIPLDLIGPVTDQSELYNFTFQVLDRNWKVTYSFTSSMIENSFYTFSGCEDSAMPDFVKPAIDGVKSSAYEWNEADKLWANGETGDAVYIKNDQEYLYLYIESSQMQNAPYFHLFLSGNQYEGAKYNGKYALMLENWSGAFQYAGAGWGWKGVAGSASQIHLAKSANAYEFQIPLQLLREYTGNSTEFSITFQALGANWAVAHSFSLYDASISYSLRAI